MPVPQTCKNNNKRKILVQGKTGRFCVDQVKYM